MNENRLPLSLCMHKDLFEYFEFFQNFHFDTLSKIRILESPMSRDTVLILVENNSYIRCSRDDR